MRKKEGRPQCRSQRFVQQFRGGESGALAPRLSLDLRGRGACGAALNHDTNALNLSLARCVVLSRDWTLCETGMSPGSGTRVRREQRLEAPQVFSADRRGEALRLAHAVDEDEVTDRDEGDLPRFSAERCREKVGRSREDEDSSEERVGAAGGSGRTPWSRAPIPRAPVRGRPGGSGRCARR